MPNYKAKLDIKTQDKLNVDNKSQTVMLSESLQRLDVKD